MKTILIFDLADTLLEGFAQLVEVLSPRLNIPGTDILSGLDGNPLVALLERRIADATYWQQVLDKTHWLLYMADLLHYVNSTAFITSIEFQLVEKKFGTANILVERLLYDAKAQGRKGLVITFLVLKAINLDAHGKSSQALDILKEALSLAEWERCIRTFVEFGRSLAELLQLRSFQRKGRSRSFGHLSHKYLEVIATVTLEYAEPADISQSSTSTRFAVQPLSKREIQILRLVATGIPNLYIARELIISAGTVRSPMHNICNKLDARNPTEAVTHARSMNLR